MFPPTHASRHAVSARLAPTRRAVVTPRATVASCHMLDNGADVRFIQAMLGHASLATTERYTHVAISKLQQVHAATHPARLVRPAATEGDG